MRPAYNPPDLSRRTPPNLIARSVCVPSPGATLAGSDFGRFAASVNSTIFGFSKIINDSFTPFKENLCYPRMWWAPAVTGAYLCEDKRLAEGGALG